MEGKGDEDGTEFYAPLEDKFAAAVSAPPPPMELGHSERASERMPMRTATRREEGRKGPRKEGRASDGETGASRKREMEE